jgi:hypothetical protein
VSEKLPVRYGSLNTHVLSGYRKIAEPVSVVSDPETAAGLFPAQAVYEVELT